MIIKLTAAAGKTTNTNNEINPPSGIPAIIEITVMKIDPLTSVPTPARAGAVMFMFKRSFSARNKARTINAVSGLSIIFAICPPGAPVVSADITPVASESKRTYFGFGNKKIPKNIIDNNISGFTPKKIGGMIACKTAPIPTNNDKIMSTLTFINLISPLLISSYFQLYTHCQLRNINIIIAELPSFE